MRGTRRLQGLILLCAAALVLLPAVVSAQGTARGTITGKVVDEENKPVPYASVMILGTAWGSMTRADGTYEIKRVPPGSYNLKVTIIGYSESTVRDVRVDARESTSVDFTIKKKVVGMMDLVEITAAREIIDLDRTETRQDINTEDMKNLPVDEVSEMIGLKAGVVAQGGELHFRGGRGGEVQYQVDGVPVRDPLVGGGVSLAALAVESADVIMGGLDAQYGNAQSGVINYKTKEGGQSFEGEIYYQTDDYGQPDNTYDNLDRVFVGVGGPSPIKNLTYYLSAEGTWQDNYPATAEDRPRRKILEFISVGDRKNNNVRLQGKLAYRIGPSYKLTAEMINNDTRRDVYIHAWSREGYVQTFLDTTQTGEVIERRGRWAPTQVDSTYQYYNAAEHTPNYENLFRQAKVVWTHTIDANTFYTLKLSRSHFIAKESVQGKEPWEYEGESARDFYYNYYDGESSDFFVTHGDYAEWSHRDTKVLTGKVDFTKKHKRHTFQAGVEAVYNDMRFLEVDRPYQTSVDGQIGATRTRYHYYNPEGAAYIQDRWEHEGMVLNLGLRYDVFSVGEQIPISDVRERVKEQFSPRIGIAYPISDRDVFSFHYGRFYQIPDRQYIFDNRNVFDGRVRGNPNLTNETTVSYQAGIQHLFSELVSGQFSVYYKDIFGLLTTDEFPVLGSVGNIPVYVNKDYASAQGFEATLRRSFGNNFQTEINYAFGVATGVGSDPNARLSQNFAYFPVSEQPLPWDVRHTLSTQLYIARPGEWGAGFVWQYSTGFPYTPIERTTREVEPEDINSRRLPSQSSLDIQAEKYYTVWGQRFKVFLRSLNVLDSKNVTTLSPGNRFAGPALQGNDYRIYYTETGRAGGAYLDEDFNGDGIEDFVPLNDPRVFGEPRTIRVGVSFSF
ncbi:MAG: TonB-dependent receptor [Candidatus Eisenbacteria bacterium]|nr:TonB-dependent receptor [Candidatus Latescibacterota bacterium]MBD3301407.1 TonB-dependent receptor [Candidatus Eisenbacteria bacterium]